MRANSWSRSAVPAVLVLAVVLAMLPAAAAQNKGTKIVVYTPYSTQINPTANAIKAMKARASKARIASISDGKIGTNPVAFSTCQGVKMTGMPAYRLAGTDAAGKAVTFDLSELDELRVKVVEDGRSQFDVTLFPTIPIAALLKDAPSYTQLRETKRSTSSPWIRTTVPGGTDCLVEQVSAGQWIAFAHLGKLDPGTTVTFGYRWEAEDAPVWWAIPSVTRDAAYPFKRTLALKR